MCSKVAGTVHTTSRESIHTARKAPDIPPKYEYSEEKKVSNTVRRPPSEPHLIPRDPLKLMQTPF